MQREIVTKQYRIKYELVIKPVKNINMHLDPTKGIVVSANQYVPVHKIDQFVSEKVDWILSQQKKIVARMKVNNPRTHFMYLGVNYPILFVESKHGSVKFTADTVTVYASCEEAIESVLNNFLKQVAMKRFPDEIKRVYERMRQDYMIPYPTLKIRKMKTRWGSCMTKKHVITLNVNILHYDLKFLEYVTIHEFAHFIQPNHSKQFYYVIEKYMPDYKKCAKLYQTDEIED